MIKIPYDHVFLSIYSTVSIQKFKRSQRTQNATQLLLVFIILTSEKNIKRFSMRKKEVNPIPWDGIG